MRQVQDLVVIFLRVESGVIDAERTGVPKRVFF